MLAGALPAVQPGALTVTHSAGAGSRRQWTHHRSPGPAVAAGLEMAQARRAFSACEVRARLSLQHSVGFAAGWV